MTPLHSDWERRFDEFFDRDVYKAAAWGQKMKMLVKSFIRTEKEKSYQEGAAAEREEYVPMPIEWMTGRDNKYLTITFCPPDKDLSFFYKEVSPTNTV